MVSILCGFPQNWFWFPLKTVAVLVSKARQFSEVTCFRYFVWNSLPLHFAVRLILGCLQRLSWKCWHYRN